MGRGRSCGHHPVLPTTRGQKMIRHRRCGCDTKLCRDHCCAQCLSKLRGWPPASFPALHGQGLQRGLVQPVRLMPAPVVRHGRCGGAQCTAASCSPYSGSSQWCAFAGGSTKRLPSHTADHVWAVRADNHGVFKVRSASLPDCARLPLPLGPVSCGLPG